MSDRTPRFSWGHININVSNLERSVEFYEKLGFEVFIPGIPYLGLTAGSGFDVMPETSARALGLAAQTSGRACIMQLDNGFPKIDLTEFDDNVHGNVQGDLPGMAQVKPLRSADLGIARLCLATRNLREDHARLSEHGVEFISAPQLGKDGLADVATCIDPDGTLIELLQVYLDKWPSLPPGN
jgi:catechol 2,3-dioxygenase-like lactoylglutathione lyase family enzyme